ncbi:Arc family DNA-binding protein [Pseudomonas sp. G34]|uniref:Arc family DNA-binding protein n=1 Tax=Pseudomonas sp. G34 TaxID=3059083 RepID=UPI002809E931|nr:Arc family DNA-binding protein [Pseudomonas sp. G34]MDQ7987019.1 Arc family DNA-binding protein [Pseudomonas sp. G34]
MANPAYTSSSADKFVVRLPDGMRKAVEELAGQNFSSMNTEIIRAIEAHLKGQVRQKLLLDALQAQVVATKAPIREQAKQQADVDYIDGLKTGTR